MAVVDTTIPNQVIRVEDAMAIVSTPLDHARVHRGDLWVHSTVTTALNDAATYVLHLKTHADVTETHLTFDATGSGACYVRLYEGPTVSNAGTALTPVNRQRITARQQAKSFLLYHTPTTSDNGTLLLTRYMGAGQRGDGDMREAEWVLKANTSYLIILESDAASNIMTCNLVVYEKA